MSEEIQDQLEDIYNQIGGMILTIGDNRRKMNEVKTEEFEKYLSWLPSELPGRWSDAVLICGCIAAMFKHACIVDGRIKFEEPEEKEITYPTNYVHY